MAGKYFEELEVGMRFSHQPGRTVTETDNLLFSTMSMNVQPLHVDAEFAKNSQFGQILVNSMFTLATVIGLSVGETTLGTTVGNLGFDETRFPNPVFIGDTIYSQHRGQGEARVEEPARVGHRHLRTPGDQPARRTGLHLSAERHDHFEVLPGFVVSRVRRCAHFVPGANEKMLGKSMATAADALVLDLEDAVTPENKDEARGIICGWLADVDFGRQERMVRINPVDTPWFRADVEATMVNPPDSYLVPKLHSAGEVRMIDRIIGDLERQHGHPVGGVKLVLLATETPAGALVATANCRAWSGSTR